MMKLPEKLTSHKSGCHQCYTADSVTSLCRIGRRLYLGWISGMNQRQQMLMLFQLPEDQRKWVQDHAGLDSLVIADAPAEGKSQS